MLVARDVEVRAGARLLLEHASFQVAAGDKIGLVGRNGAGKTTLTKILSGEAQPASGTINSTGTVGYLPQDPRTGDLDVLAKNRILSARGLDAVVDRLRRAELAMGDDSAEVRDKAMAAYARAEAELAAVAHASSAPRNCAGRPLRPCSYVTRLRLATYTFCIQ